MAKVKLDISMLSGKRKLISNTSCALESRPLRATTIRFDVLLEKGL